MVERNFETSTNNVKPFNKLVKSPTNSKEKKTVSISNEFNFGGNVKTNFSAPSSTNKSSNIKQGRPIVYDDLRLKATKPKKVSPSVDNKLSALLDYMTEFSDVSGRVSFDKQIDTLIDYYIENKLGASKKERLNQEIKDGFDKLLKKF